MNACNEGHRDVVKSLLFNKKANDAFLELSAIFQSETLDQSRRGKSADTTSVFAIFAAIASRIKRAKRGLLLSKYRHDLFRPKN